MPQHLKALIVIFGLALPTFLFFKPVFTTSVPAIDFHRRRNLWFFLTASLFITHSFWLYIIISGAAVLVATQKDDSKVGAYFFLLFAIPPINALIPGFGIVNVLFSIDYPRLITLLLLLPLLFVRPGEETALRFPSTTADKCILGYLALTIGLIGLGTTITDLGRNIFNLFVDIFLPYYAASRTLSSPARLRDAMGSFLVAAAVMAPIALFEMTRAWALYASLASVLDVQWNFFGYLLRDGALRADASAGHPLVLAYIMIIALGFFLYLQKFIESTFRKRLLLLLLLGGVIAPLSRGPWLGGVLMLLAFIATGKYSVKQITVWVLAAIAVLGAISASPYADKLIAYIPFVGHVDDFNVTYRQLLIENCITLLKNNPFFGVPNALGTPELQSMRQGQGIIDIVNTYVGIALGSGLVGLSLFSGVFLSVGIGIIKALKKTRKSHEELHLIGRVLLAVLVAILVMIGSVSSILTVPIIYWMVAGMSVAYLDLVRRTLATDIETVTDVNAAPSSTIWQPQ